MSIDAVVSNADPFEQERPGWIWVLTIQNGAPEHLAPFDDEGGDICGCYATRELLVADMEKMGKQKYGIFHMLLEQAPIDYKIELPKQLEFQGDLDKGLHAILSRASNEELSKTLHGGGYATKEVWGKVAQLMIERIGLERHYDVWNAKSTKEKSA